MNHLSIHGILFAERSRLEGLSRGFRGTRVQVDFGDVVFGLVILAAVVGAIWILSRLLGQPERGRPCNRPGKLFRSLCKAHGLRWSQWWLLWRVARQQRLRDPARLFLEPERLDPTALGLAFQTQAPQLRGLRSRLFAGLSDEHRQEPAAAPSVAATVPRPPSPADKPAPSLFTAPSSPGLDLLWSPPSQSSDETPTVDSP